MDAREAPDARHVPFRLGDNCDACRIELRAQAIQIVDAQALEGPSGCSGVGRR